MKKVIAIFFLLLFSVVTVAHSVQLAGTGFEQVMETEDKKGDGKKDVKEYTVQGGHKCGFRLQRYTHHGAHTPLSLPRPVLDQPVPPPNLTC
ncbi:MAG: hypothetical protein ACO1NX_03110 [Chitinophagaceae bacterium]